MWTEDKGAREVWRLARLPAARARALVSGPSGECGLRCSPAMDSSPSRAFGARPVSEPLQGSFSRTDAWLHSSVIITHYILLTGCTRPLKPPEAIVDQNFAGSPHPEVLNLSVIPLVGKGGKGG